MKLYFSPGSCSLAAHVALREANVPFELEQVHLGTKRTRSGLDYRRINPKGSVPALEVDGELLTEVAALLPFIADRAAKATLAPPPDAGIPRVRLHEWLNYIATELHKGFSPLFRKESPELTRVAARDKLIEKLEFIAVRLGEAPYLLGDDFSVADAYLFTVLRWLKYAELTVETWPSLAAYYRRIEARPAVQAVLAAERAARG